MICEMNNCAEFSYFCSRPFQINRFKFQNDSIESGSKEKKLNTIQNRKLKAKLKKWIASIDHFFYIVWMDFLDSLQMLFLYLAIHVFLSYWFFWIGAALRFLTTKWNCISDLIFRTKRLSKFSQHQEIKTHWKLYVVYLFRLCCCICSFFFALLWIVIVAKDWAFI